MSLNIQKLLIYDVLKNKISYSLLYIYIKVYTHLISNKDSVSVKFYTSAHRYIYIYRHAYLKEEEEKKHEII